jgi:p-aminobenzoyl-glutamate transporter AbgT
MAQTKRKRRTKHRGNAAGSIEARGRTGRKPTAEEQKANARQTARDRRSKPPTWNGAALKALAMAVLLFVLTQVGILGNTNTSIKQGLFLALLALVIYTPLAYTTDRWVYGRMLKRQQQGKS